MNYSLETPTLDIHITKVGIELCSVKSKSTGKEYMWQGNPAIWGSHAPVLFPIIGALKNGMMTYNGESYSIPKHGLIRNSEKITLVKRTQNSLKFSLMWDEESLWLYPFKFEIQVTYTILENMIQVDHSIFNHGSQTMLYSVGGHPAFKCPVHDGAPYDDYYLEFEYPETDSTWLLDSNGLVSDKNLLVLDNTKVLPIHKNLFDNDALIFKNLKSRMVSLKNKTYGKVLSMRFEDFKYLGIWAKPSAPFICIEPWLGITDSSNSDQHFEHKEGLLTLEPEQEVRKSYSITFY